MVSSDANSAACESIRLPASIVLPTSTEVTRKGDGDDETGGIDDVGAGALEDSPARLQPSASAASAHTHATSERRTDGLRIFDLLSPSGVRGGNPELLARADEVGILDLIPVRLEDPAPLIGVAVHALGDLREAIACDDGVGLLRGRRRGRRG